MGRRKGSKNITPVTKKAVKKAVKKVVKKKALKKEPLKKETTTKRKQQLKIDVSEDMGTQVIDYWQREDPGAVFTMYASKEHSLGVKRGMYSGLANLEQNMAILRDSDFPVTPWCKMIEISGAPDSGKCFTENNYITTPFGIIKVAELFEQLGEKLVCTNKIIDVKHKYKSLINEDGDTENISELTFNNKRKAFRVITEKGYQVEITDRHPLRTVLESNGFITWKTCNKLEEGNWLVLQSNTVCYNKILPLEPFSEYVLSYITGSFIADGCFRENCVSISNNDPDILCHILKFAKYYGFHYRKYKAGNTFEIHFNTNNGIKVKKILGIKDGLAADKVVPKWIRIGGRSVIENFLKGYFDCECHINKKGIEVSSASKELLTQVQLLLLSVGIVSSVNKKHVKKYSENSYWILLITGKDARIYRNIIGTNSKLRKNQFKKFPIKTYNYDCIPFQKGNLEVLINDSVTDRNLPYEKALSGNHNLTTDMLTKLLKYHNDKECGKYADLILNYYQTIQDCNYVFDKIKSIECIGSVPTFDVVMQDTHTFNMGGIINHNTTYCKYMAAKTISLGGVAIYIDWEHKYDPEWLFKIGKASFGLSKEYMTRRIMYIDPEHVEWYILWTVKMMKTIMNAKKKATEALESLQIGRKPANYEELKVHYEKSINMPFIVINDSIASMYTKAEVNDEEEDKVHVALLAKQLSEKLKLVRKYLGFANTLILSTNQERDVINIGGPPSAKFGKKKNTPGGYAWKHNCDIRINVARIGKCKRTRGGIERIFATDHRFRVIKNQTGVPPFQEDAILRLYPGHGFSSFYSILEACVVKGIVKKNGSQYSIASNKGTKLDFGQTEVDEIAIQYPKLEGILHKLYKKKMEGTFVHGTDVGTYI